MRRGFTLIELMIYIAITSIAILVLTSFLADTTANAARTRAGQDLQQNARLVSDRLTQLVHSATLITTTASSVTSGSTTVAYDSANKKVTIGGNDLTTPKVSVTSFTVSPASIAATPPQVVTISFTITTLNTTPTQTLPVTLSLTPHTQLYQ